MAKLGSKVQWKVKRESEGKGVWYALRADGVLLRKMTQVFDDPYAKSGKRVHDWGWKRYNKVSPEKGQAILTELLGQGYEKVPV